MKITTTSELINAITSDVIDNAMITVYSLSSRNEFAQVIINDLADLHPSWRNTLISLAIYPIQKWAYHSRQQLNISWENFDEKGMSFFGIQGYHELLCKQKDLLYVTDSVVQIIDEILNDISLDEMQLLALQVIHGCDSSQVFNLVKADDGDYLIRKEKLSKYHLRQYYKKALETVCKKYAKRINKTISSIADNTPTDDEIKTVYHDADCLIRLCRKFKSENSLNCFHNIYPKDVCDMVEKCVDCLSEYPFKSKDVKFVISNKINSVTNQETMNGLGKSEQYMRDRYNEGIAAISMLLWGYSSSQIIGFMELSKRYRG